ncbi:MAG: hypothetical protein ACT4OD_04850 [Candidatus Nitrosotenuis sp.]
MTVAIYLAHVNPLTNAHVEIINDLKKDKVVVMPVIFLDHGMEINSKSFPFSYEIRKKMLVAVFGDSIKVSPNYTFNAPFYRYFPPILSPYSWKLRAQILSEIDDDYYTYTGDKIEGLMLKAYRLNPQIGTRKEISASSVKDKLYESARGKQTDWQNDIPKQVEEIIKENWSIVERYANSQDMTTRIAGMKFPKTGLKTR